MDELRMRICESAKGEVDGSVFRIGRGAELFEIWMSRGGASSSFHADRVMLRVLGYACSRGRCREVGIGGRGVRGWM